MDEDAYKKEIERQVLDIIEQQLQSGQMDANRAREIARFVLEALEPHMDFNEMLKTVQTFDDHFPELAVVVGPVIKEYEDKIRQLVLQRVDILLKEKKIHEANQLLTDALDKKIRVE